MRDERGAGGGFCGLIVLVLAVFGAYQLYQRVTGNSSDCAAVQDWYEESFDRFNELQRKGFQMDPDTSTRADMRELAAQFEEAARAERASNPPEMATELSHSLARFYNMMEENWTALAEGDDIPFSDSVLLDQGELITTQQRQLNDKCN
jgi:hypothetical protein